METNAVQIRHVYTIDVPKEKLGSWGVPVIVDRYWIMSVGSANLLVALDIQDSAKPVEVSRLEADSTLRPHWLAKDPGPNRIVVGAENGGEDRMLMALLDPLIGKLS